MKEKLNTEYQFPINTSPVYANGVTGGVNVRGEIVLRFFTEMFVPSQKETFHFRNNPDKQLELESELPNPEQIKEPETDLNTVRVVTSEVIMNYGRAQELYEWLGEQLDYLKQQIS